MPRSTRRRRAVLVLAAALAAFALAACGGSDRAADGPAATRTLVISSIPDQDPQRLATRDGAMAALLSKKLGLQVRYVPVTDYAASVSLFATGDLDLVFYGGLTGVQARLRAPGAALVAQRDVDAAFRSTFIASAASGVGPVADVAGLAAFRGKRFTFGSETSTSGRLMPEHFLRQAGVVPDRDLAGPPGFSGSHDKTIDLVQAGAYEGGAVNSQVWAKRKAAGTVDATKVVEVLTSPAYRDYHWLAGPKTDERFGTGATDRIREAILGLDAALPEDRVVLEGYGAQRFVPTDASGYAEVEQIGRQLGLVTS